MAPIPIFLPGKFHGQRNLAGYSPQGHTEPDITVTEHSTDKVAMNICLSVSFTFLKYINYEM